MYVCLYIYSIYMYTCIRLKILSICTYVLMYLRLKNLSICSYVVIFYLLNLFRIHSLLFLVFLLFVSQLFTFIIKEILKLGRNESYRISSYLLFSSKNASTEGHFTIGCCLYNLS